MMRMHLLVSEGTFGNGFLLPKLITCPNLTHPSYTLVMTNSALILIDIIYQHIYVDYQYIYVLIFEGTNSFNCQLFCNL